MPAHQRSQQHPQPQPQNRVGVKRTPLVASPMPTSAKKTRYIAVTCAARPAEPDRIAATASEPSLDALPSRALRGVAGFAAGAGGTLSGVSRAILKAVHEVHLKIDTSEKYKSLILQGFFGDGVCEEEIQSLLVGPAGTLPSGRVVTRITICMTGLTQPRRYEETPPPWHGEEVNEIFEHFVRGTIPSLRSVHLNVEGGNCPVLKALIPRSSKRYVVAPNLTRVVLRGQGTLVHKAGKAINAGLWPALEELNLSDCRANAGHFENLARAITSGRLPNLRLLNWDKQSEVRRKPLDDVVLSALASGRCPLVESLSFTDNRFCPEYGIDRLGDALRACPNLRVLEMDCSRSPGRELRTVASALEDGDMPLLRWVFLRATKAYDPWDRAREGMEALRGAAEQRAKPVEVSTEIKTR